jgi:hypothetical protein
MRRYASTQPSHTNPNLTLNFQPHLTRGECGVQEGADWSLAGPLWLGPLHQHATVTEMAQQAEAVGWFDEASVAASGAATAADGQASAKWRTKHGLRGATPYWVLRTHAIDFWRKDGKVFWSRAERTEDTKQHQ